MEVTTALHSPSADHTHPVMARTSEQFRLKGRRIIIVVGTLELGGAERQALRLADYLAKEEKALVEFWALGQDGIVAEALAERDIPLRRVPVNWFTNRKLSKLRDLFKLAMAFRQVRPDAILSYLIVPNVACGLIWRWSGAQLCVWNQRCAGTDRLGQRIEQLAIRRVPWFATNSTGGAEFLTKTLGAPVDRVRVIRNAIELTPPVKDRNTWRRELEIPEQVFVATMVANLSPYKDHYTLIRAWRHVLDEIGDDSAKLLLAGRSEYRVAELKALAFDLQLGNTIRFLGPVSDIAGLWSASDLAVLSSVSEGSPNAILEAMAMALPAVGTDNPGMREVLGPDASEFLAPSKDAQVLADRITKFAKNRSLAQEVGIKNKRRVESEYDPQVNCQSMATLIADGLRST